MLLELESRLLDASRSGDYTTVFKLIKHNVNVNCLGPSNTGPLAEAIKNGQTEIVKILIGAGADPSAPDALLNRPIHFCARSDNRDSLLIVLHSIPDEGMKKHVLLKNHEGYRPIDFAKVNSKCYSILKAVEMEEDIPEYEEISDVPEIPGFSPPKVKEKKKGKGKKGKGKKATTGKKKKIGKKKKK